MAALARCAWTVCVRVPPARPWSGASPTAANPPDHRGWTSRRQVRQRPPATPAAAVAQVTSRSADRSARRPRVRSEDEARRRSTRYNLNTDHNLACGAPVTAESNGTGVPATKTAPHIPGEKKALQPKRAANPAVAPILRGAERIPHRQDFRSRFVRFRLYTRLRVALWPCAPLRPGWTTSRLWPLLGTLLRGPS